MFMHASQKLGKLLTYYQTSLVLRYNENWPLKTHQQRVKESIDEVGVS